MLSKYNHLAGESRVQAAKKLDEDIKNGNINILKEYQGIAQDALVARRSLTLSLSTALSLGVGGLLVAVAGLEIAIALSALSLGAGTYKALKDSRNGSKDIKDGELLNYLSDEQILLMKAEADRMGEPTTAEAKAGLAACKALVSSVVQEEEESDRAAEPEATTSEKAATKTKPTAPDFLAEGKVSADFLEKTMSDRADALIKKLKADGCDIEQFLGDQILGSTGAQRAGKTTLLLILSILELAKGKSLTYVTVDDDLYPVKFTKAAWAKDGEAGYQKFLEALPKLSKGNHKNDIWFLDECTKAVNRIGANASDELWNGLLTGFVKTGMSVRMVCHGTTAKAMGIPGGLVGQAKDESTFVKALRARDVLSEYDGAGKYPSGQYRGLDCTGTSYTETSERFHLPQWLLFDKNESDRPCYVHSLLNFFPELDTRLTGELPPLLIKSELAKSKSNEAPQKKTDAPEKNEKSAKISPKSENLLGNTSEVADSSKAVKTDTSKDEEAPVNNSGNSDTIASDIKSPKRFNSPDGGKHSNEWYLETFALVLHRDTPGYRSVDWIINNGFSGKSQEVALRLAQPLADALLRQKPNHFRQKRNEKGDRLLCCFSPAESSDNYFGVRASGGK